jgi:hypothetical protein
VSNPAPILTLSGRVHAVTDRTVEALPARDAERDDNGNVTRPAYPARDGYDVTDVTILTADGGFCTVVLLPDALTALGGEIPAPGTEVEYAVRCFVSWQRNGARSFSRVGFSVAGDVTAARRASGRRPALAATGS